MKRIAILLNIVIILVLCACGNKSSNPNSIPEAKNDSLILSSEINFDTLENDLGTISEGERVIAYFEYENVGERALLIQNISAGCGCTVPSWSKLPLNPGQKESIKVIFDSTGKNGTQNIKISVNSNAINSKEELRIKAIVQSIN